MRYCLSCRSEYQDWVHNCIDCGAALVDKLPQESNFSNSDCTPNSNSRKYTKEKIITIATFNQPEEAQLSQAKLESEGIPSFVADSNFVSANRFYSIAAGGVKLQVRESDAEIALSILNLEQAQLSSMIKNETEITDEKCPNCRSTDIQYDTFSLRHIFISILLLGFPLLFFKRNWKCRDCGHEWKEAKS
jgi:hypothetical protein